MRARITQVMDLLNPPVAVQEGILTGEDRRSERQLRAIRTREAD